MPLPKLKSFNLLILILLVVSGCSNPTTEVCGIKVNQGQLLPIKVTNTELLNSLATLDRAEQARKEGKQGTYSFSNGNTLALASGLSMAGVGSDGKNLILRSVEAWESSIVRVQIEPLLCSLKNS